jgi:hypothetical protein
MADKPVKSVTQLSDGNVIVTYTDLSTKKMSALNATNEIAKAKLAGSYVKGDQTPGAAFGTSIQTGAGTNNTTPIVTSENLTAYYQQALSSKADGYSKIRSALTNAGLLGKGSKSLSSVQNAWLSVLQGASQDGTDPYSYIANIKRQGAGLDTAAGSTNTGTRSYPTITNATDAEANINKAFQERLGRDATTQEAKDFTKTLNDFETKNPTKVTYSANGQKTFGGLNIGQYLSDVIDKDAALKKEADVFKQTAPDLTKRLGDKKVYDELVTKATGDPAKLQTALDTTAYGRGLKEFQASLASNALSRGLTNTPDELNAIAKDLYDKGIAANSQVAADAIAKVGKYGANKEGHYTGAAGTTFDDLQKTATANGLDLNKAFGSSVNDWLSAISKGESVDTFKRIIRDAAKIGMPDNVKKLLDNGVDLKAIYSPYKNIMASTLEINPETISFNDPLLRSAITADKEVPLYEFERQLRKDSRWQYTQQANKEVGDATQQILKDFGFMG